MKKDSSDRTAATPKLTKTVQCAACGKEVERADVDSGFIAELCPHCGSDNRTILVSVAEHLQVKEWLKGRKKDNALRSKDKVRQEFITGDELNHTGKWIKKERIIDKDAKTYLEIVTDPDTGTEIHRCKQALSDHKGHGSAKGTQPGAKRPKS